LNIRKKKEMVRYFIISILLNFLVLGQNQENDNIYIAGEYERRLYAGERIDECRTACIDSAKNNLVENYIFNRFSNHIFSDAQRKLCILELKPLIGQVTIISETDISRRNQGKYIKLGAEIDDNIFYEIVQQIIQ
tara:strand:+ start:3531 stop:3935 length:405 start_codon:yes stop_codon:yes gene_type:complete